VDLPLATPELRPRCPETASLCLPVTRSEGCNPSSLLSLTLRNARVPLASAPFHRFCHTPYPLARLRVARLPSRRSGLTALWMGGSPSHPSSSRPPTSLRDIKFGGQRAAFGSPGQWSPNTVFNSRWKLTPPFQVPSTAIVVSFLHIPSQQSCNKFKTLFTFIDLFLQVHLHHIFILMSLP
jgi:hypothetical protein